MEAQGCARRPRDAAVTRGLRGDLALRCVLHCRRSCGSSGPAFLLCWRLSTHLHVVHRAGPLAPISAEASQGGTAPPRGTYPPTAHRLSSTAQPNAHALSLLPILPPLPTAAAWCAASAALSLLPAPATPLRLLANMPVGQLCRDSTHPQLPVSATHLIKSHVLHMHVGQFRSSPTQVEQSLASQMHTVSCKSWSRCVRFDLIAHQGPLPATHLEGSERMKLI